MAAAVAERGGKIQTAPASKKVRVKEGRIGYYNNVRWRAGQVFELNDPVKDYSEAWMERAPQNAKTNRPMSGKQALDRAVAAIQGGGTTHGITSDMGHGGYIGPSDDEAPTGDRDVI